MKSLMIVSAFFAIFVARVDVANAQNLLLNGNLDAGAAGVIDNWTLDQFKTFSGPTTDLLTGEGFIEIAPITNGGGDADRGGFVKAFQGNPTTGDLATVHMFQNVAGVPSAKYVLTGMIGAGVNYSGLLAGATKTELAIEFDADNNRSNGMLSSVVTDVKAAGLTSGPCCAFGAKEFM